MRLFHGVSRLLILGGLGYLGFFAYVLVMGMLSPTELVGLSVLALLFAATFVVHAVRLRRAMRDPNEHARIMHELQAYRERRGF
jgi:Ca2+/Na+ antiporter